VSGLNFKHETDDTMALMLFVFSCSATTGGDESSGRGSNGGVWEWTTTVFAGHEGLVPTDHFTG